MKFSVYNSYIRVNDTAFLLYNASSNRFIVVKHNMDSLMANVAGSTQCLKENYPELYNQMTEISAIINDDVDEQKLLKEKIDRIDNDPSTFQLHINPTLDCTFRCWYCYEEHKHGTLMDSATIESVKRLADNIIDNQHGLKNIILSFFGGEPLIGFENVCKPLTEYIYNRCAERNINLYLHFTSNAFLVTPAICSFLSRYNSSLQITLDGHRAEHNKVRCTPKGEGSYDRILNNIQLLLQHNINIGLRINYTARNLWSITDIISDLAKLDINDKWRMSIDFQQVWQDKKQNSTPEIDSTVKEYVKTVRAMGFSTRFDKIHDTVNAPCYGDKRYYVLVNYNGDVYRCTAREFNRENRCGTLSHDGKIEWENDSLEKRMKLKFSRKECLECRIAPLCGGGCRQQAFEAIGREGCIYGYTDADIDDKILSRFENNYLLTNCRKR